jgi:hypothetical protein
VAALSTLAITCTCQNTGGGDKAITVDITSCYFLGSGTVTGVTGVMPGKKIVLASILELGAKHNVSDGVDTPVFTQTEPSFGTLTKGAPATSARVIFFSSNGTIADCFSTLLFNTAF